MPFLKEWRIEVLLSALIKINKNMVTLQLNQNQAEILLSLLDMAIKAGGLNVAEAAVFFSKTIDLQLNATQKPAEADETTSVVKDKK